MECNNTSSNCTICWEEVTFGWVERLWLGTAVTAPSVTPRPNQAWEVGLGACIVWKGLAWIKFKCIEAEGLRVLSDPRGKAEGPDPLFDDLATCGRMCEGASWLQPASQGGASVDPYNTVCRSEVWYSSGPRTSMANSKGWLVVLAAPELDCI